MKKLKFIFGKLSILYYILFLLVTCVLCKYGSIRQLKFAFLALGILLVLSLCIWIGCLIAEKENPFKMKGALRKTVFGTELLILLALQSEGFRISYIQRFLIMEHCPGR